MEVLNYPWIAPVIGRLPGDASAMPRALLLTGSPGLGKRHCALFLAQSLLCETKKTALQPCGTCASCRLFQAGNHPDLRILEVGQEEEQGAAHAEEAEPGPAKKPSKQIAIQAVRALADLVTISAHRGGAKVICIIPAEAMHVSAANAVLKILEEPPGNTFFLLVSHQPERLLSTIRSRCFHLPFSLPDAEPALAWLKGQGLENADLALAQAGYAPLGALERARDETFWEQRSRLLNTLASGTFDPLHAADCAESIEGPLVVELLSHWAYDIVALQSGGNVRYHLDYAGSLQRAAHDMPIHQVMRWYETVIQFGRVAQHPLNKRLAMESLLCGYPAMH
jgi:DNA polymerase-3 subunit delta'